METKPVGYIFEDARVFLNKKLRCWSVQQKVKGRWRTVAHQDSLEVQGEASREGSLVRLVVNLKGRERTLKEGKKYVHAFVYGDVTVLEPVGAQNLQDYTQGARLVWYNPRESTVFKMQRKSGDFKGQDVHEVAFVVMHKDLEDCQLRCIALPTRRKPGSKLEDFEFEYV